MPNVPYFAAKEEKPLPRSASVAARLNVGIVGAGKVGAVLGAALRAVQHKIMGISARSAEAKERAELLLPGVPVADPEDICRRSDMFIVAVPDDYLPDLIDQLHAAGCFRPGQLVIHTSGHYGISVLAKVRKNGAIPFAIHPVMSFTGTTLDLKRLEGTTFGITADTAMTAIAQALVFEMGGDPVIIAEADRPLYHAAITHSANHLTTLVSQSIQILSDIGVEDPGRLLKPILKASLENTLNLGENSLTGPIIRGDYRTVSGHAQALLEHDEDIAASYRDLALATTRRAFTRNLMDRAHYQKLLQVFGADFFEIDPHPKDPSA